MAFRIIVTLLGVGMIVWGAAISQPWLWGPGIFVSIVGLLGVSGLAAIGDVVGDLDFPDFD